jgi:glycine/D-amino acid oxidase-like deaminating enzyme
MPLIGATSDAADGLFFQAAMTGVGLMSSAASGELLAAVVSKDISYGDDPKLHQNVPFAAYADALSPQRFHDANYVALLSGRPHTRGQM